MTQSHWFRNTRFFFAPVRWQGWVAYVLFVALLAASAFTNGIFEGSLKTIGGSVSFLLDLIILTVLFYLLCCEKVKREERVRRWWRSFW